MAVSKRGRRAARSYWVRSEEAPRSDSARIRRFFGGLKEKFATSWEERHLAVPATAALPEVLVALMRVHLPPMSLLALRLGGSLRRRPRIEGRRRWIETG
jgi:hypothetical protein